MFGWREAFVTGSRERLAIAERVLTDAGIPYREEKVGTALRRPRGRIEQMTAANSTFYYLLTQKAEIEEAARLIREALRSESDSAKKI